MNDHYTIFVQIIIIIILMYLMYSEIFAYQEYKDCVAPDSYSEDVSSLKIKSRHAP